MTARTAEHTTQTPGGPQQRIAWIDIAKGVSIVIVALHHSYLFGGSGPTWPLLTAEGIRYVMPVFFLASGLTLSFALGLPMLDFLRRRALPVIWIYVIWTLIYAAFNETVTTLFPWVNGGDTVPLWRTLYWPWGNLWFVWVLAAFTVFAGLVRALPPLPVVLAAYLAAIAGDLGLVRWESFPGVTALFITYLPFFLTGAFYAQTVFRISTDLRRCLLIGATALALLIALSLLDPLGRSTLTLRYGAGTVIGLVLAVLIAHVPWLARLCVWLGLRSLAIFVGHALALALIMGFLWPEPWFNAWFQGWPVVLAGLGAVCGALLLQAGLMRAGLRWLYVPPRDLFAARLSRSR